jgi:hypothetical protein
MGIISRNKIQLAFVAATLALTGSATMARAQEATYSLTIHEDRFEPSTITVPAAAKIQLRITNATKGSAEFESAELNREKIIPAGQTTTVFVGPLSPGSYPFFNDFKQTTRGRLIAK